MLSAAFCYPRYAKVLGDLTGFGMIISITLPSLAKEFFNSLRDENDESFYTYNDESILYFVRQTRKEGRCAGLNQ